MSEENQTKHQPTYTDPAKNRREGVAMSKKKRLSKVEKKIIDAIAKLNYFGKIAIWVYIDVLTLGDDDHQEAFDEAHAAFIEGDMSLDAFFYRAAKLWSEVTGIPLDKRRYPYFK